MTAGFRIRFSVWVFGKSPCLTARGGERSSGGRQTGSRRAGRFLALGLSPRRTACDGWCGDFGYGGRMAGMGSVAVVGAGMAGLSCARALADAGVAVTVLEKSRGLGGRLATRRAAGGGVDHGAVALQVEQGSAFAGYLRQAAEVGAATFWPAAQAWVGLPGMSGIVQPLARGVTVQPATEVTGLVRAAGGWRLQGAGVPDAAFGQVILALPQPQARALLLAAPEPAPDLAAQIAPARLRAVWTAMLRLDASLPLQGDVIHWAEGPVRQAVRNSSKPGRGGAGEAWVLHAAEDWTAAYLEREKPEAAALLLAAFFAQTGVAPVTPVWLEGHRWRHGLTVQPLARPFVRDAAAGLAVCGDWCLGDSAADAFASGQALAAALLQG